MDWDQVALALNQADIGAPCNAFQCERRWNSHLNPSINKGEWTKEEDRTIIELQKNWGNKWAKIARELSGRTNYAVMNRWSKLTKNGSYAYAKKSNGVDVTTTEARMLVSFPPPVKINLKDIDFDDDDVHGQIASLFLRASLNE